MSVPRIPDHAANRILLTGATGFVGRFLLAELLQMPDATAYCLVRAHSRREAFLRLRSSLSDSGLWKHGYESRIEAIPGDLREARLGLSDSDYRLLTQDVDSVYHCGASVNHLESYESAKCANVFGTRELLKIAIQARASAFHHISTLAVFARNERDGTRVVNEATPIEHERHRRSSGYAASKWAAECMILNAMSQGLPCNIYRLGLLWADSRRGHFDDQQHVYRLVSSCLACGFGIENHHYDLDPVPVDYAARAVVTLSSANPAMRSIFHITSLIQESAGLFEQCNRILPHPLTLLPPYDWICEIKRLARAGRTLPIAPLIEYAFSMDRNEFAAHSRFEESRHLHIDCQLTAKALERRGILPPRFSLELIAAGLERISRTGQERGALQMRGTGTNLLELRKRSCMSPAGHTGA
jgi:thioester reductase-like protein